MRMRSLALVLVIQGLFCPLLWGKQPNGTNGSPFELKFTNATPLVAGTYDREILNLVGEYLQRAHYRGQPLDDEVSSQFLDRYLDALDPQHIFFTQSDVEEFETYRYRLDELILDQGDAQSARAIFRRFRTRVDQQYDHIRDLLSSESFQFKGDETFILNRKDEPRPKTLEDARKLWRQRLLYEYLQEKLNIGQPQTIANLVREQLQKEPPGDIAAALEDKVSKEKAQDIAKLVREKLDQKLKPDAIIQALLDRLEKDTAAEIVKIIGRRYNRILRSINEYDNDDVLQIFLTALAHVYDPHSDYMGKASLENFSIGMKLSLFGIGALLQSEDGYCKIVSLTPNGPAERGKKLKPNDRIIAVAQGDAEPVDVVDMKLSKVVEIIRGPKGTEVRLTVIPADAPDPSVRKVISIVRDEVKLEDQEAKAKVFELTTETNQTVRLGLIDLPSFYSSFELSGRKRNAPPKSTTTDVARLIKKLAEEKVSGLILDLRRNGGGSLEEAINLTGLFIKEGPVVQVRDPNNRITVDRDPDPSVFYQGPLVVLTSRFSASASEILAGALQDYHRAVIVGDTTTHGKGTVQSLVQLGPILRQQRGLPADVEPGALKITIRKFYRASGASTQRKGVQPDIILPSINNHADVGEASLENALPWDEIPAADFEKVPFLDPFLAELRRRSEARVSADADFQFIREEIERYKKIQAEKKVSLNEAQRRKEKEEADLRLKARKKDLAARPAPPGKVFEVTLRDVDTPGLPDVKKPEEKKEPAQAATSPDIESEGETPEEKATPVDAALEEAKRILADLIALTVKSLSVTTAATEVR